MADTNLTALIRELWLRSLRPSFLLRMPVIAKLLDRGRVSWEGGTKIKFTVDKAEMDSLAQSYGVNDALSSGTKTMLDTPEFEWRFTQVPLEYTVKDMVANGGGEGTRPVGEDFVKFLTRKGQRATRLKMLSMMWATGSSDRDGSTATDDNWHSIPDALTHDITYGGITRATTSNAWFQGASIAQDWADWDTNLPPSIDSVQQCIDAIRMYSETDDDLLAVCGNSVFRRLKAQIQAQVLYRPGSLQKYGHQSMYIDNVEVVADPWLEARQFNSAYATTKKYFTILNTKWWHYRIHPQRAFEIPDFQWQGNFPNGRDKWLTRVLMAGNLVCEQPAGSIFKSDMW